MDTNRHEEVMDDKERPRAIQTSYATCLNCGALVVENFCPKCGQKKEVERLTWRSLAGELFHFLTHIEKGFLNTSWRLLIWPDRVIGEYLSGKRKKYFKPVSLYLIWVAIHLLAYQFVTEWMHYENLRTSRETQTFIVKHSNMFGLLLMPILSFVLWLIVTRPKLNYIESFAAIVYTFAAVEILIFFQIVIVGLLLNENFLTDRFLMQIQAVTSIWTFYCCAFFLRNAGIRYLIPRILLALLVGILINEKLPALVAEIILKIKSHANA